MGLSSALASVAVIPLLSSMIFDLRVMRERDGAASGGRFVVPRTHHCNKCLPNETLPPHRIAIIKQGTGYGTQI